ncbi:hypothetical protein MNB_SV-3-895 [hydrothermal vent metagenome]|uniref:Uncharacterized protein n=1 Tax=hydrothermal vent metagenome TaxID=652676 RepID=A0A1W1BE61_9ZZZZ
MSSICFVTQEATAEILLRVTNVCAECYDDIKEGDTVHYDMQNYRYLCMSCQEKLCTVMNEECKVIEEDTLSLF